MIPLRTVRLGGGVSSAAGRANDECRQVRRTNKDIARLVKLSREASEVIGAILMPDSRKSWPQSSYSARPNHRTI